MNYDPMIAPAAADWLQLDEFTRMNLIEDYHRHAGIRVPNEQAHAIIHAIVENQLALRVDAVVTAMQRLAGEGLDRHEALHAVGTILAGLLHELMHSGTTATPEVTNDMYATALGKLSAAWWREQYGSNAPRGRR
jgi:hypothetical protein